MTDFTLYTCMRLKWGLRNYSPHGLTYDWLLTHEGVIREAMAAAPEVQAEVTVAADWFLSKGTFHVMRLGRVFAMDPRYPHGGRAAERERQALEVPRDWVVKAAWYVNSGRTPADGFLELPLLLVEVVEPKVTETDEHLEYMYTLNYERAWYK